MIFGKGGHCIQPSVPADYFGNSHLFHVLSPIHNISALDQPLSWKHRAIWDVLWYPLNIIQEAFVVMPQNSVMIAYCGHLIEARNRIDTQIPSKCIKVFLVCIAHLLLMLSRRLLCMTTENMSNVLCPHSPGYYRDVRFQYCRLAHSTPPELLSLEYWLIVASV